jgi:signal transduction histidine kinase
VSAARTFGKELGQALERTRVRAALEEARKVAHAASEAKSAFLATMSHELRTPINAILGFTALLDLGISSGEAVRQAEYVTRIRKSTEHLLELINDVLDWSRVEAGHLAVNSAEAFAKDVIDDALNVVRDQAIARGLTLDSECVAGATYVGDPLRVRQILLNLLSNAIKFTEAGGRVRLACSVADALTTFAVEDSGIGIAPEELEMIFEPFVQAEHGYTRTHGGTGLGLTISRTLARTMGGDVTVESRRGEGSTFSLLLPSRISRSERAAVRAAGT